MPPPSRDIKLTHHATGALTRERISRNEGLSARSSSAFVGSGAGLEHGERRTSVPSALPQTAISSSPKWTAFAESFAETRKILSINPSLHAVRYSSADDGRSDIFAATRGR
jgi:hypothetical protein